MKQSIRFMGVINLTPDSFSDGHTNLIHESISEKLKVFSDNNVEVIDIGAESTAPFNDPVSSIEELNRFQNYFYPFLKELKGTKFKVSLDTYKYEVFLEVTNELLRYFNEEDIIWNDVSGKIDQQVFKYLKNFKGRYIFCHNLAPSRLNTSHHMNYIWDKESEDFLEQLKEFFLTHLSEVDLKRVILDPCFGFSKTREQNLYLVQHYERWFESLGLDCEQLIGISKKSFLRSSVDNELPLDQRFDRANQLQKTYIENLSNEKRIFRVHQSFFQDLD